MRKFLEKFLEIDLSLQLSGVKGQFPKLNTLALNILLKVVSINFIVHNFQL